MKAANISKRLSVVMSEKLPFSEHPKLLSKEFLALILVVLVLV